jgi:branched-chain amino acid transport system substrate-binding protein
MKVIAGLLMGVCCVVANAQVLNIGISGPLTGANAELGQDISKGAQAYFRKVNAEGGVQGRQLNVISLDDKNDRKTAGENAKKLLTENKVVALFGFASATLSLDAAPHATEQKTVFFAPFTGASSIKTLGPFVFTLRATYDEELAKLVNHWQGFGFTKVAVLHYDDEVGNANYTSVANIMTNAQKKPISIKIKRNVAVTKATADEIVASGAEILVNTTLFAPMSQVLAGLKQSGKNIMSSSISFVGPSQLVNSAKTNAGGVVVSHVVPAPNSRKVAVVRECAEAMSTAGFGELNHTSLESCIAAKVMVEGMRRIKGTINRDSLYTALDGLGTYDAGGYVVNFSKDHFGGRYVDLSVVSKSGMFLN